MDGKDIKYIPEIEDELKNPVEEAVIYILLIHIVVLWSLIDSLYYNVFIWIAQSSLQQI